MSLPGPPVDGRSPARARFRHTGVSVMPIGLGCMGMSQSYGPADDDESIRTIRAALDLGVQLLDTSDFYGAAGAPLGETPRFGHNEEIVGRAVAGRREEVVLATKFAVHLTPENTIGVDNRPAYIRAACDASLRRLGVDVIDLYYCHRVDRDVPVEETVGVMSELVSAGKVRAIGMSEVKADVLRRAASVFPIAALQSEYSLWERGVEGSVLDACAELGTTLVPHSPLGRGMLTGGLSASATFAPTDFRRTNPKFTGDDFVQNLRVVAELTAFAAARGVTAGQVALAWLLAQPHEIAPIPGTKRLRYVEQNVRATAVPLSADDVATLSAMFDPSRIRGRRYARTATAGPSRSGPVSRGGTC